MNHLDKLEAQSVYIFREAFTAIDKIAMLWSSLREDWLSPEGRTNTVARIAYLESLA